MSYLSDITEPLIRTLQHFAGLPVHQLAGHAANFDFWQAEFAHRIQAIDSYQGRFKQLKKAQGDFAKEYGSSKCLVQIGCNGPIVYCNVPRRGWQNGVGGCPNIGGICMACTMPGFPDKFMPFMDEAIGAKFSSNNASFLHIGSIVV